MFIGPVGWLTIVGSPNDGLHDGNHLTQMLSLASLYTALHCAVQSAAPPNCLSVRLQIQTLDEFRAATINSLLQLARIAGSFRFSNIFEHAPDQLIQHLLLSESFFILGSSYSVSVRKSLGRKCSDKID